MKLNVRFIVVLGLLCALSLGAVASMPIKPIKLKTSEKAKIEGITYQLYPKKAEAKVIKADTLYAGEIIIPDSVACDSIVYKVIEIDARAFSKSAVSAVVIPASVEKIGGNAFEECNDLTAITIPPTVTDLGPGLFSGL